MLPCARVVDPERAVIAVADAQAAVYQLALTALRNCIGQHDLDEVLRERDKIDVRHLIAPPFLDAAKVEQILDERVKPADAAGIVLGARVPGYPPRS